MKFHDYLAGIDNLYMHRTLVSYTKKIACGITPWVALKADHSVGQWVGQLVVESEKR